MSVCLLLLSLSASALCQNGHSAHSALPSLVDPSNAFLIKQYIDAITAYGPGLGVYTPYSYVDISYDNIPGIGKIPLPGKEGTSSRLGISPFYPPEGNPGNPFPPLYKARPLPPHIPEPVDVVAVPLDEEALHGEPLFPPELTLPSEKAAAKEKFLKGSDEATPAPPADPFAAASQQEGIAESENRVDWAEGDSKRGEKDAEGNSVTGDSADDVFFQDSATEKSMTMEKMEQQREKEDPVVERGPKNPFASVVRRKRVKCLAQTLGLRF